MNKFIERYELTGKIHCKRFVRTYHEMCQALHSTKYIPNFDKTDQKQKRGILVRIFGDRANRWDDEEIERKFHLIMSKEIRDIHNGLYTKIFVIALFLKAKKVNSLNIQQ